MPLTDPEPFADIVGAALRQLPGPTAPHTLLPRVMAAAQQWARRPWYVRAWFTWPLGWQLTSIAVLCATVAGTVMLWPLVEDAAATIARMSAACSGCNAAIISGYLVVTMNVTAVLWRTVVRPMMLCAAAFGALMCLACAVFGTVLHQVVFGRAVQP
jgi:hypothetical protein